MWKVFLKEIKLMNIGDIKLAVMMAIVSIYIVGDMIVDTIKEIRAKERNK